MSLYDLTKEQVKDGSGKLTDPADYNNAVTAAIKRYSKHRPLLVAEDLPGTGSHDLDLPTAWVTDFSAIMAVEYPVGNVPATMLGRDLWQIYRAPVGLKLRILHVKPDVTDLLRVEYSILHDEFSIPAGDLEAVAILAAANCFMQLAAAFGQSSDSTIQADTVDYKSKTDEFRRLADKFEKQFKEHLGLKDSDTTPAAMVTARPPEARRPRLTHWH